MIVANHLTKRYGRVLAVDGVNFAIPANRVVGFLGPNGAGKSTTIRMIAGYLPPTSGTVTVDGMDVMRRSKAVRMRIGYLPESAPLYTEMRVTEFLKFRAKLFGIGLTKRRRAIDLALQRCGLEEVRRRPIHQLSKGYRQRVGFAAALLHQPPVLILDEPTVGLDPAQIREMRGLIRELGQHHTILLSTHILPEVELTCDHIIMIARGKVRAEGTVDELKRKASESGRYIVETDSAKAGNAIRSVSGVADVQSTNLENGWRRLTITASDRTRDLREQFAAELSKIGGMTRELSREAPSLEHLFVSMIADAEMPGQSDAETTTATSRTTQGASA